MENGLSASDVALMNRDTGFGGEAFMWIFALLILAGGGFGGGWGGNNANLDADMQRGFDTQNLQAQTRDILAAVTDGTSQGVSATNQSFHDSLMATPNLYNELARDIAALQVGQANALANQNECCCSTKMLIQQTSADNALAMSQMEARLVSKMDANEIQALRDKVGALELANATSNIVRYPNAWTYPAAPPFTPPTTSTTTTG